MFIPRWKAIADLIAAEIADGKLATGDALPSETEMARQWNVSRMTAHRAMHELHQQGLVIRKRHVGTTVAPRREFRIGRVAVFLNTHDFLEQAYLCGIRSRLPDEADLLFCDVRCSPQREAYYLDRMRKTADGILMIATCDPCNTPIVAEMLRSGVNIVCLDSVPAGLEVTSVVSDNYGVCREALQYLVNRGHRRIAHFTEERLFESALRERYDAYLDTLADSGVTGADPWIRQFAFENVWDPAGFSPVITAEVAALMRQPDHPTALFCTHDYILSGVIQASQTLGVRIPEDLEIVSFNDCPPIVPYLPSGVHRIVQQAQEMGKAAAEQLCRLSGQERPTPEVIRISPVFFPAEVRMGRFRRL